MREIIINQIKFLKKIKHEYLNQPSGISDHVEDDLIDLGIPVLSEKSLDFDKHYINKINNQINLLKSKVK